MIIGENMNNTVKLIIGILLAMAASLLAISTEPIPTNPWIDCMCAYVHDDQNYTLEHVYDLINTCSACWDSGDQSSL